MSDGINVQDKSKKTKFIIAVAAAVIAVLTIIVFVMMSSNSAIAKKVKEQLSLGDKYLSELQYEQAIAAYELAIEIDPKCEDAYLALAEIYIETGEFEKAEEILDKAEDALGRETEGIKALREKLQNGGESEIGGENESEGVSENVSENESESGTESISGNVRLSNGVLEYEIMKDGNVRILGLTDQSLTELMIPEQIDGKQVTEIGLFAFSNASLQSIGLPKTISVIGQSAFGYCKDLTEITIQDGVQEIGESAFAWSNKLERIVIPGSVKKIGLHAFGSCTNLKDVEIQNGVECIGELAFSGCQSLKSIVLPDTVTVIEDQAFSACENLASVTIPNNQVSFGVGVFDFCNEKLMFKVDSQNSHYVLVDGVLYSKDRKELVQMPFGAVKKEFRIPDGVTRIGNSAFSCCYIEKITFPDSLVHIGEEAFQWSNFTTIVLPDNLETIGRCAFGHCGSLSEIEISSVNKYFTVVDGVLFSKDMTKLVLMPVNHRKYSWSQSYQIPSTVTTIGNGAFFSSNMQHLVIPEGVKVIEEEAFAWSFIRDISLPSSLKIIGERAFYTSYSLENIVIPGGVRTIGSNVFESSYNLKKVVIQEGVTTIGTHAFLSCSNASVEVPKSVTEFGGGAFSGVKEIIISQGSRADEYVKWNGAYETFEVKYR